MKFAFIANVAGVTPETYSTVYETKENYALVAGVDGMDAAKEYVKKLAGEGFDLINLCGDFDDEITAEMQEIAGENIRIKHADYTTDETVKLNFLESFKYYGIIILLDDEEKIHEEVLRSEACDAHIMFVKDMRTAKNAAKMLLEKRMDFIELCSWFDRLRLDEIVEATENRLPIGTCGELDPSKIQ